MKGQHAIDDRHPQRVPRPGESVHPRQLRHLHVHQHRVLRAGFRAAATTAASRRRAIRSSRAAFRVRQWGFYVGDQWSSRPRRHADLRVCGWTRRQFPTSRPRTRPPWPTSATPPTSFRTTCSGRRASASTATLSGNGTRADARRHRASSPGRPAYVWISNQFGNTGIDFTRIGAGNNAANRIPFVTDPLEPADDGDRRDRRDVQQRRST